MIAIAEATPGVIAVNTATFVGYKIAGLWGGCIATLGAVLPSFIIISIISRVYVAFRQIAWIDWAFSGIRAGVVVLILGALIKMIKKSERDWLTILIAVAAFGLAAFTEINCVFVILVGAVIGIIRNVFQIKRVAESCTDVDESGGEL